MFGWWRAYKSSPVDRDAPSSPVASELRALDEQLRAVVFEPRASLGPELEGRIARGERPRQWTTTSPWRSKSFLVIIAVLGVGMGLLGYATVAQYGGTAVFDRCCFDLDGGGDADDGVAITAARGERVTRLVVYEDRDRSHSYTAPDLARLDRGARPTVAASAEGMTVTTRHCCFDLDGGGLIDDGILVVGRPPDQVVLAGVYEIPASNGKSGRSSKEFLR